MHPLLNHFNVHSFGNICKSKEKAISFLQDLEIVPKRTDDPPSCPACFGPMTTIANSDYALGWKWICKKRKRFGQDKCTATVNPLKDTFFENVHLPINFVLMFVFHFVKNTPVTDAHVQISMFRKEMMQGKPEEKEKGVSIKTAIDFYYFCREIAEIFASNYGDKFGGPGKTIELDETFLSVRKYGKGNLYMYYISVIYVCNYYYFSIFSHASPPPPKKTKNGK